MSHGVPHGNSNLSARRRSFEEVAIELGFSFKRIFFGFQVGSAAWVAASPLCLHIGLSF